MAQKFTKDCCGCAAPGYPCRGSACTYGYYTYYCDECGSEVPKLYKVDNQELCDKCALETFDVIE